jgi:Flp pilus assembly protein TadB
MSKERARRRAARLAEAKRQRSARAAAVARRQRRRALVRRLTPRLPDRRTGRLFARRTRVERAGIVALSLAALGVVWLVVEPLALRLALIALLVIALPALVVISLDRRG